MSAASFNADLKKFGRLMGLELDTVVRKIALDAHDRVTEKTPVDTGRARGNWNMGAGKIDRSVDEGATQAQQPSLQKGEGEKPIYITNNLPYINALEKGSSAQAPSGMVAVTMSELEAGIKNVMG